MLINTSNTRYCDGDIISMKLVTGDELVAKFISEDEHQFTVTKPLAIVPGQNGGVGLMQIMLSVNPENKFEFKKHNVLCHGYTMDQLKKHYQEVTSGIAMVR